MPKRLNEEELELERLVKRFSEEDDEDLDPFLPAFPELTFPGGDPMEDSDFPASPSFVTPITRRRRARRQIGVEYQGDTTDIEDTPPPQFVWPVATRADSCYAPIQNPNAPPKYYIVDDQGHVKHLPGAVRPRVERRVTWANSGRDFNQRISANVYYPYGHYRLANGRFASATV